MKAMSLRIRIATLSPCLTPSFCKPLAMRSERSATSSWPRLRGPLMTPRKGDEDSVIALFFLLKDFFTIVMAGQKREARLGARCPGHPRTCFVSTKDVDHRDEPGDDGMWR